MTLSAPYRLEEVYSMSVQLALRFDEVPITCETQKRYHSIAPCLAGRRSAEEQADALGLSYSAICRWLRQFRDEGIVHSKKSILRMKTAFIDCAEANFLFVVVICIVLS